jgi:hypothetical protein
MTNDLITWLRAQLDEVEAAAARDLASIERHDLAVERLVEVDVKRRILDLLEGADDESAWWYHQHLVPLLALPYADRDGYRQEWRP